MRNDQTILLVYATTLQVLLTCKTQNNSLTRGVEKENGELVTKKFTDMGGKKKERKKLMNNIK